MNIDWKDYPVNDSYDEIISSPGYSRRSSSKLVSFLRSLTDEDIKERINIADSMIKTLGISFTVYSDSGNIDRQWPLDIIPRVIAAEEWKVVEAGLIQRLTALNHFINDVYNDKSIIHDGIFPEELIKNSVNYRKECEGIKPLHGVWAHICGTDLVRDHKGKFLVLEDNLRVPSGVSYMLENRKVTKRVLPELFDRYGVQPLRAYTSHLFDTLTSLTVQDSDVPEIAILTPGIYNSAYFEHAYLAQQMGVELVEGNDLIVERDFVYMKTIAGLKKVDVIYRRVDDLFLDPEIFNPDSVLGVPGLMRAWKKGNVALANAPGAGVADDKVVYTYVPAMIEYYLNEKPILPNVPSYLCGDKQQRDYVINHIDELVIKPANESGGYGMLIGPQASKKEKQKFIKLIKADARNYMAQPLISLSTCPVITPDGVSPRHIDLRPFVLQGKNSYVTAGGLTRVAMNKGSYVVNSSQGGGSKDTWIVK
tara:strand:- start:23964 stop:25400 length:1437 start_codon:yes stop_codon:yes gene_type:complete